MDRDKVRQVINVVAVIAVIVVNGLANALPINGQTTGDVADMFDVYFVPAGYVFSIWGLIYVGLIAFAVYQALPDQRENPRLRRVGYLFALSCVANVAWLFLWHYEFFLLTMVMMVVLLALLIAIYLRLGIGRADVPTAERWLIQLPISIYLGWISVATIANATTLLAYVDWGGWGISPGMWAVVMLAAGVVLAAAMGFTRGDVAYMLVIVWAFAGIALKHRETALVATSARIATGVVAILAAVVAVRKARS